MDWCLCQLVGIILWLCQFSTINRLIKIIHFFCLNPWRLNIILWIILMQLKRCLILVLQMKNVIVMRGDSKGAFTNYEWRILPRGLEIPLSLICLICKTLVHILDSWSQSWGDDMVLILFLDWPRQRLAFYRVLKVKIYI